ncbi:hypothetical protein MYAM1_000611 [Malassezia yamatoensis]|uniref:C2 domain-containing protein n=1 Tax=Malassezia yamatoensis TaxID=253288 RepID=A0AAJ6CFM1_9BASI|nr:hypothetical protein MYAM1_000611 [Malassezia yamatoensis]
MSIPLSHASGTSSTQQRRGVTDGDIYVYALQTAYLAHLLNQAASNVNEARPATVRRSSEMRLNLTERMRELKVGSASGRNARLPDKFVRRLMESLERIAMGRDPLFHAPLFRQTIGAFYGTVMDQAHVKSLKEQRNVEELILLFFQHAQTSLKKRISDESEWQNELQVELKLFSQVIKNLLAVISPAQRELVERLEDTTQMLSSSVHTPASSSRSSNEKISELPLLEAVGSLFDVYDGQLARDIESIRPISTLTAAMVDLKRCVYRIHARQPWPGVEDDFISREAYKKWRSTELDHLSRMMLALCKAKPDLLSAPSASDSSATARFPRASSDLAAQDLAEAEREGDMTFVPPDANAAYQRILERCIDKDLDAIRSKREDEEVSLAILSALHKTLLDTCADRWLISQPFRALANLRTIKARFDRDEVPMACLQHALDPIVTLAQGQNCQDWSKQDLQALHRGLSSLADSLLRNVYAQFQAVDEASLDDLRPTLELVEQAEAIRTTLALECDQSSSSSGWREELMEALRVNAIQNYTAKTTELFNAEQVGAIDVFSRLLNWIHAKVKALDQKLPKTILGFVPVDVIIQKLVPLYLEDVESMRMEVMQQVFARDNMEAVNDALALFERIRALISLYDTSHPPFPLAFQVRRWFAPYVERWLLLTERHALQWVHNAVHEDNFEAMGDDGAEYSTSIRDLSDALQQPLALLKDLAWPDAYEKACFYTMLAKLYGRVISEYAHAIEKLYMLEMVPVPNENPSTPVLGGLLDSPFAADYLATLPPKQAAWLAKAKQTIAGEKKVQPFLFQPKSCVKLNNIEAARKLLDTLYQGLDADKQAKIVTNHLRNVDQNENQESVSVNKSKHTFLFSVKIVQAELTASNSDEWSNALQSRFDTFVTLSDKSGTRLAKSRTIYNSLSPRWNEVFDIPSGSLLWVSATIWRRQSGNEPQLYGRAPFRLDPRQFRDQSAHELWLSLDGGGGKLLVRVSMERAHDDILFYFGRAFRVLKRSEVDMVRVLVDHMSLFMRQFLSRSVVRSMVRGGRVNLDRAIGNVKALYASALAQANGTAALIPPVDQERRHAAALSDQEIEAAIVPLLDYFEVTLGTLKSALSESQSQLVLTRVWKEVLSILESILVPPLSDLPTDMRELSTKEVDIVFKWLSFLKNYFNAYDQETGVAQGVPLDVLQGSKYRELLSYLLLHDQTTDQLMVECVREFQARLASSSAARRARSKSVLNQRSLGTIREHKKSKTVEDHTHAEMAMKILRMRPGTGEFLTQQLYSMNTLQASSSRPTSAAQSLRRTSKRLSALLTR